MADQDDVSLFFGAETAGAIASLNQLRFAIEGLSNPLRAIRSNLGELADAFVAAFALDKIYHFIDGIAEAGAKLEHLTAQLGISAESLSTIAAGATIMGLSVEGSATAFSRLERAIATVQSGTGPAKDAFEQLGINVLDAAGNARSLDDVLPEIADKFQQTADGAVKTQIAIAIGGRGFAEFIPILDKGAEGLKEFKQIAEDTGTTLSGSMLRDMDNTSTGVATMNLSFKGLGVTLFELLKPAFDEAIGATTSFVEALNQDIIKGGVARTVLDALVIGLELFVAALDTAITAITSIVQTFEAFLLTLVIIAKYLDKWFVDVFTLHWAQAKEDTTKGLQEIGNVWAGWFAQQEKQAQAYHNRIKPLLTPPSTGNRTPDPKSDKPPPDAGGAKEAEALANEMIKADEKAALTGVAIEQEANQKRFAMGKESLDALVGQELSAENKIHDIKQKALNDELAADSNNKTKKQADKDALVQLELDHQLAVQKIENNGAQGKQKLSEEDVKRHMAAADQILKVATQQADDDYKLNKITADKKDELIKKAVLANQQTQNQIINQAEIGLDHQSELYKRYEDERTRINNEANAKITASNVAAAVALQQLQQKELQDFIKLKNDELKSVTSNIDFQRSIGLISEDEKVNMERSAVARIAQIQTDAITKQENDLKLVGKAYDQAEQQKVQITQQANLRIQQLDQQLLQFEVQRWQQFAMTIGHSFSNALSGMLQGTMTWRQALTSILNSVVQAFAQMGQELLDDWIKKQVAKLFVTQSTEKSSAVASITTQAAIAGAGGVASMAAAPWPLDLAAPEFGAAMAEAAMGFGTLLGFSGGGVVDNDMLAKVHTDEMVLPAHLSKGVQQMVSQGGANGGGKSEGDHYHISISAVDAQSVSRLFQASGGALVQALARQQRHANPNFNRAN